MITKKNYLAEAKKIDFSKLSKDLQEGHDLTNDFIDLYDDMDKETQRIIDSYIASLNKTLTKKSNDGYEAERKRQLSQGLVDKKQEGISLLGMTKGKNAPVPKRNTKQKKKADKIITFADGFQWKVVSKDYAKKHFKEGGIFGIREDEQAESLIQSLDDLENDDVFGEEIGFKGEKPSSKKKELGEYTAKDYLKDYSTSNGDPYEKGYKYSVEVYNDADGSRYTKEIWGESKDDVHNDLGPLLADTEAITVTVVSKEKAKTKAASSKRFFKLRYNDAHGEGSWFVFEAEGPYHVKDAFDKYMGVDARRLGDPEVTTKSFIGGVKPMKDGYWRIRDSKAPAKKPSKTTSDNALAAMLKKTANEKDIQNWTPKQVLDRARQFQSVRSERSTRDEKTASKKRLSPNGANLLRWMNAPGSFDLIGIDSYKSDDATSNLKLKKEVWFAKYGLKYRG